MTIQIAPLAMLLIGVGFAVGISVFKYTARATHGVASRGDLGVSIAAATAVVGVLAVLLAPGFGQPGTNPVQPSGNPAPSSTTR